MVNMIFHADHAGNTCQLLTECILRGLISVRRKACTEADDISVMRSSAEGQIKQLCEMPFCQMRQLHHDVAHVITFDLQIQLRAPSGADFLLNPIKRYQRYQRQSPYRPP